MKPQHPPGREGPPMPHNSNYGNLPTPRYPPNGYKSGYPPHGLRHPDLFPRNMFPGMFHADRFQIPSLLAMNMHHHPGGRAPARHGYLHPFPQAPRPYTPHGNKSPTRNSNSSSSYSRNRSPDRSHSGHGIHRYSDKKGSYEDKSSRKQSPVPPRDSSPAALVSSRSRGQSPSRPTSRGPSPHKHSGSGGKSPSQLSASGRSPKAAGSKSPLSVIRNTAVSSATGERSPLRITIGTDSSARDKNKSESSSTSTMSSLTSSSSLTGSLFSSGTSSAASTAVSALARKDSVSESVVCVKPTSSLTTSTKTLTTVIKLPSSAMKSSGSTHQSLPLKKRICTAYALEQDTSLDIQGKKIHVITDLTTTSLQASGRIDPLVRFGIPAPPPRFAVEMGDVDKRSGKSPSDSQASRKRKTDTGRKDVVPAEKKPKQSPPGKNQRGKPPSSPPQPTRKSSRKTRATWRVADKLEKDQEKTKEKTGEHGEEEESGPQVSKSDDKSPSASSKPKGTSKSAKKDNNQSQTDDSKTEPQSSDISSKTKNDKGVKSSSAKSSDKLSPKTAPKTVKVSPRQSKPQSGTVDKTVDDEPQTVPAAPTEPDSVQTGPGVDKDSKLPASKERTESKSAKSASRSRSVSRNKASARSKSASMSRKDSDKPQAVTQPSSDKDLSKQRNAEGESVNVSDQKDHIDQSESLADSRKSKDRVKTSTGTREGKVDRENKRKNVPINKKQSSAKSEETEKTEVSFNKKVSAKSAVNKHGANVEDDNDVHDAEAKIASETVKKTGKIDRKQASASKRQKSNKSAEKDGKSKVAKDQQQVSTPVSSKSGATTYVVKETSVQVNRLTCSNISEALLSQLSSSMVPLEKVAHIKSLPIEGCVPKDSPAGPEPSGTVKRRSPRTRSKQMELLKKSTPTITSLLMDKPMAPPLYNVSMEIPIAQQFPIRIPHLDPIQVYQAARSPNGTSLPAITGPLTCETTEKSGSLGAVKEDVSPQRKKRSPGKLSGPKSARRKQAAKLGDTSPDEKVREEIGNKSDGSSPMKDLKVHICKLSPKALDGKRTTSARQLEKTSCPNSQSLLSPNSDDKSPSPSKTSPRRREKGTPNVEPFNVLSGPQRGSGFLEDLLWQVQKGYFLRHGREEGAVSIEEAAAVTQAVVSDGESPTGKRGRRNSEKASPGAVTSPTHHSECGPRVQVKTGDNLLSPYHVPVDVVSDEDSVALNKPQYQRKKHTVKEVTVEKCAASTVEKDKILESVQLETPKSSRVRKHSKEKRRGSTKSPTICVQKTEKLASESAVEDMKESSVAEIKPEETTEENKTGPVEEPSVSSNKDTHEDKQAPLPGLIIRLPKTKPKPRGKRKGSRKSLPVDSGQDLSAEVTCQLTDVGKISDKKLNSDVEPSGNEQLTQDKLSESLAISGPPQPVQKTRGRNHKRAKTVNIPLSSDISDQSLHSELGEKLPDKTSAPSDSGYSDECSVTTKISTVSANGASQCSESAISLGTLGRLASDVVTLQDDVPQSGTGRGRAAKRKALTNISKSAVSESKLETEQAPLSLETGLVPPTKKKRGRSKATHNEDVVPEVPVVPPVPVETGTPESEDNKSESSQPPVLSQEPRKKGRPKSAWSRSQPSPPPPVLHPQELHMSPSNDSDDDSFAPLCIDLGTESTKVPSGKESSTSSVFNSPNHASPTEIPVKKFFTSHKPRCPSKMSPVAQLIGMTSPRSKSGHSPGRSMFSMAAILSKPSQKPSSESSRDVYDFDDDVDGAVSQQQSKGKVPHLAAQPAKRGRKPGKRGPKPRKKVEDEEVNEEPARPRSPAPLMREPSQPQRRFLRPRRVINYSEADGEKPAQDIAANAPATNVSVNMQKSTMSLKIKIKRPSTETNDQAPSSPQTEEPPMKKTAPPPPQWSPGSHHPHKRQRESSAAQRMTVTSETISVTTNEVASFDPEGSPLPAPTTSRPPVMAPYLDAKPTVYRQGSEHAGSEMCQGCRDGTCTTVTTRRVRFRLVKVGEGMWKTVSVLEDPLPQLTAPVVPPPTLPSRSPSPSLTASRSGSGSDSSSDSDSSSGSSSSRSRSRSGSRSRSSSSSSRSSSRSGSRSGSSSGSRSGSSGSGSSSESDGESHKEMPQLDDSAAYHTQEYTGHEIDPSPPLLQKTQSPRRGRRKRESLEQTPESEVDVTPRRVLRSRRSSTAIAEDIPKLTSDSSLNTSKEESFDSPPVLEKNVYATESFNEESSPRKTPKRGRSSTPRRPSQRCSPRIRSLSDIPAPIYEPISDYESDGEDKNKAKEFPMLLSYDNCPPAEVTPGRVTRSQASKADGKSETQKNKKQGEFAVPTPPPPKYEPENVLEEAIQFDSEMSQSSCSTPSYPIVSPLTMHENKPINKRAVQESEEIDFADSFLNGTRTLRAEIEEQIQKEQLKEQEQLTQQPPVAVTPVSFAPDFQDMDFAYDFGIMPVDPNAGAVYGTVNPADMNTVYSSRNTNQTAEKSQEKGEAGFKSPAPHGSSKSSKKSSSSKSKKSKSKRPSDEIKSGSAQQEQGDNAMDKMLSQESLGFGLLDDFDVPAFNTGVPAAPALDDLFGPSLMDQIASTPGDIECVDVIGETKVVVHRPGGTTPRTPRGATDGHRGGSHGAHDIGMGASAVGLHTCDCGAHFTDNWSYQQHEMFCSGSRIFNCGL